MTKLTGVLFFVCMLLLINNITFAQDTPALKPEVANTIKKLTMGADLVTTGKVDQKEAAWNRSKTRIFTKTTLKIDEVLKGTNQSDFIEILSPGGEVDGVGEIYTHTPTFSENEEVLVFLKRENTDQVYRVLNGEEGKITLEGDTNTNDQDNRSRSRIGLLKQEIQKHISIDN